jgi:hypothetical protein
MRLPAVAIAAAFACGILMGLHPAVVRNAASLLVLSCSMAIVAVLILTGMYFVKIERLILAAIALRRDRDGAVRVVTDGDRLEITCFVACPGAAKTGTSMQAQTPDQQQDQKKE